MFKSFSKNFNSLFEKLFENYNSAKNVLLVLFLKIWVSYKEFKIFFTYADWLFVYVKTPTGSAREKAAFLKVYNEHLTDRGKEIYSPENLPNVFRKLAFEIVSACSHNYDAAYFRSQWKYNTITEEAEKERSMWSDKLVLWTNFLNTFPDSKKEDVAIRALLKAEEISKDMVIKENYRVRIVFD
jgi:hypothetical protein